MQAKLETKLEQIIFKKINDNFEGKIIPFDSSVKLEAS